MANGDKLAAKPFTVSRGHQQQKDSILKNELLTIRMKMECSSELLAMRDEQWILSIMTSNNKLVNKHQDNRLLEIKMYTGLAHEISVDLARKVPVLKSSRHVKKTRHI